MVLTQFSCHFSTLNLHYLKLNYFLQVQVCQKESFTRTYQREDENICQQQHENFYEHGAPQNIQALSSQMISNHDFLILSNECVKSKDTCISLKYGWLLVSVEVHKASCFVVSEWQLQLSWQEGSKLILSATIILKGRKLQTVAMDNFHLLNLMSRRGNNKQ